MHMMTNAAVALIVLCLLSYADLRYSLELPESEISALKAIAEKLKIGPSLWNFSLEPCFQWPKVAGMLTANMTNELNCSCNGFNNTCHVVSIRLKSTYLDGHLPDEEFTNLTHLTMIDLIRDSIRGSIPTTWSKLPLYHIGLISNRISGEIPKEIGDISTLQSMAWENNLLDGRIPDSLGNLINLRGLRLSSNNITGELPPSLGKLVNLTDFRIDGLGISGKLPSFVGNWTHLTKLFMRGTSLEGPFPSTLSAWTKMVELRISDFKGDGGFPPLEKMSSLKYLILRNCSIIGPIPEYIGAFRNLISLDLSFNHFTGRIPQSFQALVGMERAVRIQYMYLTNNRLNGPIPGWIFGKDNIDLSYNFFTSPSKNKCQVGSVNLVSSFQSSQRNTTTFCLRKNLPCPTKATNYQLYIDCGGPGHDVNGTKYERDDFPSGTSMFYLSSNENWAYSSTGDFTGNSGAKYILSNTSALKTTNPLYLTARASASSLKYYGLCLQRGSYTVKLHFAEITFTEDQTFASLGNRFFDVAIQGRKVLQDFNIAVAANGTSREITMSFNATVKNTLEIDFRWNGKGTNVVPEKGNYGPLISAISVTPNFDPQLDYERKGVDGDKGDGLSPGAISGITIGSLVVIFLIILISYILLRVIHKPGDLKLEGTTYFSLRQIKTATRNFHPDNKIGEGGFGPVYKGELPDGSRVAVKKLSSRSRQGNREFVNEIGMISACQHPNLVKLFGYCVDGKQLLLVYEYLENNSLARALFGNTRMELGWKTRHNISLGIAKGLAYLHEESTLRVVHRDIKSTNILLDEDLNAKIADFGLAKLDDNEKTHITTRIAGTVGYMAPEYAMRGHLTPKADVYSYGVVLLEIISGKSNANYKHDECYLLDLAYSLKDQEKLLDLVDPRLGSNYHKTEAELMSNLALLCTNPSPAARPTMTSVVNMIESGIPITIPSTPTDIQTTGAGIRFDSLESLSSDTQLASSDGPFVESSIG